MKPFWTIALILCFSFSCNTTTYTPDNYDNGIIYFGHGGGFTGIEVGFALLENGQFFKRADQKSPFVALADIDSESVTRLWSNLKILQFESMNIDAPGNVYQFIEVTQNGQTNRITWGQASDVSSGIQALYTILMKMAKDHQ